MGRHLNERGEYQSLVFPDLPANVVGVAVHRPENWPALELICALWAPLAPEVVADLRAAMRCAGWRKAAP